MTSQVTHQIALQASFEIGREAARQGRDYFTSCPFKTGSECWGKWCDGFNSTREFWR